MTLADLDTTRAYAMLCKRKYEVVHDEDVAVVMLYSRTEADFFDKCARNGHRFIEIRPGVRKSRHKPMGFYAVDLVVLGEQQPNHPINLLSARRLLYSPSGQDGGLGPFDVLYEEVFLRELKKMGQMNVPGNQELLSDAERTRKLAIAASSVEERLQGIPAEDRLRGIPAKDLVRYLSREDLLHDLSDADLARLRELLRKRENH